MLNAFGLVVADMAASLDFYRAVGVDVPAGVEGEPHVDVELAPGVRLMWHEGAFLLSRAAGPIESMKATAEVAEREVRAALGAGR